MGGDRITPHCFTPKEEIKYNSVEQIVSPSDDFPPQLLPSSCHTPIILRNNDNCLSMKGDEGKNGMVLGELGQDGADQCRPVSWDSEVDQRRKIAVFKEVLQSYDQLRTRIGSLREAKNRIWSYTPGAWIESVGVTKLNDYELPEMTSLILIGPKGSGKSSLINRISKVFENDKFASERAQVTYNPSVGDGTFFLQEYMIPRGSKSFCLYDTRSLSDDESDNINMIKRWMTEGVRHGKLVIRKSDSSSLRNRMKCKARQNGCESSQVRMVNFVIFVVDGLAVLKSMEDEDDVEKQYTKMIATTFNCPYLSFRDDKPVVVVTHGDLLSLTDRARIRTYLGELLGIPPAKQIFDISENCDPENELIIVDMLCYCLEHADRNLPHKIYAGNKVFRVSVLACIHLLIILGIAILSFKMQRMHIHRASKSNLRADWRVMWLGKDN